MSAVLVVGGGPAGMMGAIFAARRGHQVSLYEKNEKLGKKLFLTGKGRCNVTNACLVEDLFPSILRNPKFLYSGFYEFSNEQVMAFFEELGVPLKVERGNRVFPVSDHSSDIIRALQRELQRLGVRVCPGRTVKGILTAQEQGQERFVGLAFAKGGADRGDACIVATGGLSYPTTGSTGDGYRFAEQCGHTVTKVRPSLVPIKGKENYVGELEGLSLRNVQVKILRQGKCLYEDFGEMLFTRDGVSGPLMLRASAVVGDTLVTESLDLRIDLKPALSEKQLNDRILRDFAQNPNRIFKNGIEGLLPAKLRPVVLALSGIDPEKKIHQISRQERQMFVDLLKNFPVTLTGLGGFEEAVITKGGISVKEICPGTMESRKVKGLYFAGEVLDLDGLTGGFNLQIAWSTGYMAGSHIPEAR